MPRRLLILGSTGSIGTQALDVVERSGGELEVVGLSAERSWESLVEQAVRLGVGRIALADRDAGARASEAWTDGEVLVGAQGLVELVVSSGADLVLNALVGSAGLGPTVAALGEGIDLALANKESLVVGGELVTALAEATGATLIPVDSEHTALHQLMAGLPRRRGRAARDHGQRRPVSRAARARELGEVSVEQALAHPTWAMGGKITIDSATLMNKGLELMEAHHLFGTPYDRIDVVVHPQSIVHGVVDLVDGASLAHLGHPDMRIPIAYALHHPEPAPLPTAPAAPGGGRQPHLRAARPRRLPVPAPGPRGGGRRRHRAVRAQRRQRGRRARLPGRAPAVPGHRRRDRGDAGRAGQPADPRLRDALRRRSRGAPRRRRARRGQGRLR